MDTYAQTVAEYSKVVVKHRKPDSEEQMSATLASLGDQGQEEKSRLSRLQISRQALWEVISGLGFAWLISWVTPPSWTSLHLSFCAFFLAVFALAIRYPKQIVYSASLLATAIYAFILLQKGIVGMSWWNPRFLLEPFLLLVSGVLMVDILHTQRQQLLDIAQKFARSKQELEQANDYNKILIEQNVTLEKLLADDVVPITRICTLLTQLWKKTAPEPCEIILNLVMQVTEAQSCAVYWKNTEQMRLVSKSEGHFEFPLLLNNGDAVIHAALEKRRLCTIRDVFDKNNAVPQDCIVIAGPLVDGNRHVIGMVVVGMMPFSKFTVSTFEFLSALLEVVSSSLQSSTSPSSSTHKRVPHGCLSAEEIRRIVPHHARQGHTPQFKMINK
jgi:hypothetical protein